MQEANLETTTGSSVTNEQWIFEDAKCDRHKQLCSAEITVSEANQSNGAEKYFVFIHFTSERQDGAICLSTAAGSRDMTNTERDQSEHSFCYSQQGF